MDIYPSLLPGIRRQAIEKPLETIRSIPIEVLELSSRIFSALKRDNINTIGHLLERSSHQLLALRNFGMTSLEEVNYALSCLRHGEPELNESNRIDLALGVSKAINPEGSDPFDVWKSWNTTLTLSQVKRMLEIALRRLLKKETFGEIADDYGLTRERVRQLEQ